ncbi:hypothetical protein DY000_02015849 [Brassica cretica]|uniref:Shugoshin C-terminal domain-containing protein n=1 Tax=Brassica cretica TaxID=69181 RepID=A0ABQ7CRE7_BRACR|nr:hypothetical protein DY000_02015849 [Brassica cretica]
MATNNRQTRADDGDTHDNVDKTPAANVSVVNANVAAFEEMFTTFKKKSEEQEKLIGSLAKQVKTLTARTKVVLPCGATKLRGRLDFTTPSGRIMNTRDKSSGQAPNETAPTAAQKDSENPPPRGQAAEEDEIERVDLDTSDHSSPLQGETDVHPRRMRSRAARRRKKKISSGFSRKSWPKNKHELPAANIGKLGRVQMTKTRCTTSAREDVQGEHNYAIIQNRKRHPEIPGPGTSIRTIPSANFIRQRGTRPRTAKFSALD